MRSWASALAPRPRDPGGGREGLGRSLAPCRGAPPGVAQVWRDAPFAPRGCQTQNPATGLASDFCDKSPVWIITPTSPQGPFISPPLPSRPGKEPGERPSPVPGPSKGRENFVPLGSPLGAKTPNETVLGLAPGAPRGHGLWSASPPAAAAAQIPAWPRPGPPGPGWLPLGRGGRPAPPRGAPRASAASCALFREDGPPRVRGAVGERPAAAAAAAQRCLDFWLDGRGRPARGRTRAGGGEVHSPTSRRIFHQEDGAGGGAGPAGRGLARPGGARAPGAP